MRKTTIAKRVMAAMAGCATLALAGCGGGHDEFVEACVAKGSGTLNQCECVADRLDEIINEDQWATLNRDFVQYGHEEFVNELLAGQVVNRAVSENFKRFAKNCQASN